MATRQALTPAAVNRRLDAMNRKKNPAITGELSYTEGLKLLATGRALSFYPRKGEISIDGFKRYSASAETIKKLRSVHAEMLSSPSRSKRDWLPSENPATKKTRRVTVVAANPAPTFARDRNVKAPDLPYSVQRWNANAGDWSTLAAFGMVDYATKWARQYAREFPAQTVRVVDRF